MRVAAARFRRRATSLLTVGSSMPPRMTAEIFRMPNFNEAAPRPLARSVVAKTALVLETNRLR